MFPSAGENETNKRIGNPWRGFSILVCYSICMIPWSSPCNVCFCRWGWEATWCLKRGSGSSITPMEIKLKINELMFSTKFFNIKRRVDVLSVKEFPKESISLTFAIIFWYSLYSSMFGPESGKNGWNQPTFVFYKVRIGIDGSKVSLCNMFLDVFLCRRMQNSWKVPCWTWLACCRFTVHHIHHEMDFGEVKNEINSN